MTTITDPAPAIDASPGTIARGRPITQYSRRRIFAIWAAAAVPMACWRGSLPRLSPTAAAPSRCSSRCVACLTVGLVWQFVLVVGLLFHEQRTPALVGRP